MPVLLFNFLPDSLSYCAIQSVANIMLKKNTSKYQTSRTVNKRNEQNSSKSFYPGEIIYKDTSPRRFYASCLNWGSCVINKLTYKNI